MPVSSVDALRSRIHTAVQDGAVSLDEVKGIIEPAKNDVALRGDLFEAGAREGFQASLGSDVPALQLRRDLPDPAVLANDASVVTWDWAKGDLFVDGVTADDVIQGPIGNCWMVAAFAAVAGQNPEAIEKAIRDNGDGSLTVTFFEKNAGGAPTKVQLEIDGQLPVSNGRLRYGENRDRSELWVGILEKAFAQWKGGYEAIGNGGMPGDVMFALTGRKPDYFPTELPGTDVLGKLQSAVAQGLCATAATLEGDHPDLYNGTGIHASHAYSIHGVEEVDGQKFVALRNPWGSGEPAGNGPDDGVFKIDAATFGKLFTWYCVC
jgi:Calpain family cysteine protease